MSLNKHIFFFCLFVAVGVWAEQGYTVCGKVKCEDDDARDIQVSIKNTNIYAIADSNGYFCLKNVPKGFHRIVAFAEHHTMEFMDVEVLSDLNVNFDLHPDKTLILQQVDVFQKKQNQFGIQQMASIERMGIYEGKKTEVVVLEQMAANTSTNNARQTFSKVSGLNIWESDCAGLQLGIGARGLSPNRTANFNVRQNGYEISADPLGYPESYYSPALEAVEKVEFVRGAGALQYGTQLGGMINFVFKKGPKDKKIELTNRLTGGSYGYLGNFTSVGGQVGKVNYYSYYQYKRGDCWRPNSGFYSHNAYSGIEYKPNERNTLNFDYTHLSYLAQQPGGLSDFDFKENPRKSTRERNWFKVNWNLLSATWNHKFNNHTEFEWKTFGLIGNKFAVGAQERINIPDQMENRVLQKDHYANIGTEAKLLHRYRFLGQNAAVLAGVRAYKGETIRKQGDGTAEHHANFNFNNPSNLEKFDYLLPSYNASAFVENIFRINSRWSVTPGARVEYINMQSKGYTRNILRNLAGSVVVDRRKNYDQANQRNFVLFGLGTSYHLKENVELYANYTQNFRAATFSDIIVSNPNIVVDSLLKDERGTNTDIGIRSTIADWLYVDASAYMLNYSDRIGEIYTLRGDRFRTNVGNSRTVGFELVSEIDVFRMMKLSESLGSLSLFGNYSFNRARYISSDKELFNNSFVGNRIEMVPTYTFRGGVNYKLKNFSCGLIYSRVGEQYTDATNAVGPVLGSHIGLVPEYFVLDFTAKYSFKKIYTAEFSVNNLTNNLYFTRRAEGYPGPGILPSDPRLVFLTLGVKI